MTKTIQCECGIYITGQTIKSAESNLKQHMKSLQHKEQIARKMLAGRAEGGIKNWISLQENPEVIRDIIRFCYNKLKATGDL